MPALSVFGAQWGDEGKGKIIDRMAKGADIVVRYQGGANAGHTVVVGDESYVLHLVPSGVLHGQALNVIAAGCAVDPLALLGELDGLAERGHQVGPERLCLSAGAHVIFDYHKSLDHASERGARTTKIGTTGRGIGPCYADKAARSGLRMADLVDAERCAERLGAIIEAKNAHLQKLHGEAAHEPGEMIERYVAAGQRLDPYVGDAEHLLRQRHREGAQLLFEGAQGALLDLDLGTYPFVTSSNTGVAGIPGGAGFPPQWIGRSVGIAKAYTTRVGEGPFPSELHDATGERIRAAGHEYGATTGRPRRCGWLDAVALRYALEINGATAWILTNLDVLTGFEQLSVATSYSSPQGSHEHWPAHMADFEQLAPNYETHPGWVEDICGVRHYGDLPASCRAYVERLEELVGVPIELISVGPERDQVIPRQG